MLYNLSGLYGSGSGFVIFLVAVFVGWALLFLFVLSWPAGVGTRVGSSRRSEDVYPYIHVFREITSSYTTALILFIKIIRIADQAILNFKSSSLCTGHALFEIEQLRQASKSTNLKQNNTSASHHTLLNTPEDQSSQHMR